MKRVLFNVLVGALITVTLIACGGGGGSNTSSSSTIANSSPKLSKEQQTFCEHYFLAIQAIGQRNQNVNSYMAIFNAVKLKGFSDVIHAFSVPDIKRPDVSRNDIINYIHSALQDLGLSDELNIFSAFENIYGTSFPLKQPELKSTFVEGLDNGTKIWLIEDYQTMYQARLLVKENGEMNIGNLEPFSNN